MSSAYYSVGQGGAVGVNNGIRTFSACGRGTTLANVIKTDNREYQNFDEQLVEPECKCFRNATQVMCRTCGLIFHGRSRMICPRHPQVIHLMDSDKCPKCRSNTLKEFPYTVANPKPKEETGERWD